MVISRILFLSTYDTTMDFEKLIKSHSLGNNVNHVRDGSHIRSEPKLTTTIMQQVSRHAKQFSETSHESLSQMDELALTDTMKLIFNISKIYPDLAEAFSPSIPLILQIISRMDITPKPLDGVIGCMINSLSTLDIEIKKAERFDVTSLFPESNQSRNVNKLISILDLAVSTYNSQELETKAITLLQLLIVLYELAPESVRKEMQSLLLPENSNRDLPIGHSDTLSSKLLNISTTPYPNLKTIISELMFVLSGKNAEELTKNIGYGFAAGFLASRGMEIPQTAGGTDSTGFDSAINPITGQRFSAEPKDPGPPMTREEKEREAERLFVLFER